MNRTCKYKEECHIVDLSWQNVNVANIKEAFRMYCGTTVSQFNPEAEARLVDSYYNDLTATEPFQRWYEQYKQHRDDVAFMLQMEDGLRQWIRIQFERAAQEAAARGDEDAAVAVANEAKRIRRLVGRYAAALMMLEDVYEIDAKYREETFLKFWEIYCRIYRSLMNATGEDGVVRPDIETDDEVPGITISEGDDENEEDDDEDDNESGNARRGANGTRTSTPEQNILDVIHRWNQQEALSAEEAQRWLTEINQMFESFASDKRFMAVLRDNTFTNELKQEEYRKILNRYRRNLSQREDVGKVFLFKKMLSENADQLFDIFQESWMN